MKLIELMQQSKVFSGLELNELIAFSQLAVSRRYIPGEWIAHHGDVWPFLFLLEKGLVSAVKASAIGRTLSVLQLTPGEILWGLAFFQPETPMPVGLRADADCMLHLWSRDSTLPSFMKNGILSWELACLMVTRMQHASEIVEELAFQPVTGRLARLLLNHYFDAVGDFVPRDLTLDDMASQIGTTREMVCRQLYKFADEGAVEVTRTEFMIKNRDLLADIAERGK